MGYAELTLLVTATVGLFSLLVRQRSGERASWPTWLLVPVVIFMAIPMGLAMPDPLGPFRFLVFAIIFSRWAVALVCRERGHGWVFYIVFVVVVQLGIYPLADMFTPKQ